MNVNLEFSISVIAVTIGLFFITYLIYGRIKKRPLVGNYKPDEPGYAIFINLTTKTKYLLISSVVTLLLSVKLVFDVMAVLQSSASKTVLISAPVMALLSLFVSTKFISIINGKK